MTWLRRTANVNTVLVLCMGAASLVFVALADSVREQDWVLRGDRAVQAWSLRHHDGLLASVARVVTRFGDGWVVIVVVVTAVSLLWRRRTRSEALVLAASSAGSAILVAVAKSDVGRQRPPSSQAVVGAVGFAFPSGHAAQGVACYLVVGLLIAGRSSRRLVRVVGVVAGAVVAVLVGLSRVVLGVHWLSDVVGGWCVAIGWLAAVLIIRRLIMTSSWRRRHQHATAEPVNV